MSSSIEIESGKGVPVPAEMQDQVQRIASSSGFKNSDPIRQVFLYLAKQAFECPGQSVKEHQIATAALGRTPDFDPRVDSTVRVVVTRLRGRLAEYYTHEGIHDTVVVDIPKGAYALSFTSRSLSLPDVQPLRAFDPARQVSERKLNRHRFWVGGFLSLVAVAAAAFFAGRLSTVPRQPAVLSNFWEGFLKNGDPLIVFSNPLFEGTPERGMHLLNPSAYLADGTNDTFTGTGEVIAVHVLTEQIAAFRHKAQLQRARLFTWDEALANNLIIVGGPAQSSVFLQLPQLENLVLKAADKPPFEGQEAVRNTKVQPGQPGAYYIPNRRRGAAVEYAILALTPGASSEHFILVMAGTNTFATQAAAKFVCNPTLLRALSRELNANEARQMPPFEALLKVEVRGGTPIEPQLLLAYSRKPQ